MATQFDWSSASTQFTLQKRDRYTEESVRQDLESAPLNKSVILDAKTNLYATSVSNDRYAVVWQMLPAQNIAKVKFVVPTQITSSDTPEELKTRLAALLTYHTRDLFTFESALADQPAKKPRPATPKP